MTLIQLAPGRAEQVGHLYSSAFDHIDQVVLSVNIGGSVSLVGVGCDAVVRVGMAIQHATNAVVDLRVTYAADRKPHGQSATPTGGDTPTLDGRFDDLSPVRPDRSTSNGRGQHPKHSRPPPTAPEP
jgi:hypothetical protein